MNPFRPPKMIDHHRRILVDTNVWISFLKEPNPTLTRLLKQRRVICHSRVIGELCVGNLPKKPLIRDLCMSLPIAPELDLKEGLHFLDSNRLNRRGLQWNDVLVLGSAVVTRSLLWTRDVRLAQAAKEFGLSYEEPDENDFHTA